MAFVDWSVKGPELVTCNCNWGCPCQFNSRPSNGDCCAAIGMRIDEGHFGDISLDGLKWVHMVTWPGAIHEGHGVAQFVIDERATPEQRDALLKILGGQETAPFATVFAVFSAMTETFHEPLFKPIEFETDMETRTGRFSVAGVVEAKGEPIRNPVTGNLHRAKVTLPHGFEYTDAEYASSTTHASGAVKLDWASRHAHFATLHLGTNGVVR